MNWETRSHRALMARSHKRQTPIFCFAAVVVLGVSWASAADGPPPRSLDEVYAKLKFYDGPSRTGSNASSLTGKVLCGYQGWHGAPGDGSGLGWVKYAQNNRMVRSGDRVYWPDTSFAPGRCNIQYWPDVSELDADEKYATAFHYRDGRPAYVYSAMSAKTVARHFRWMEEAGIDGAMVQRFAWKLATPAKLDMINTVLANARAAANAAGRTYCVMYDLSSAKDADALVADWKMLVGKMGIGKDLRDKAYQQHRGKPVLAIWGLFANRVDGFELFERLIALAKNDPVYGGFAIKLGVSNDWRTGKTPNHERMRSIVAQADIISPWTVGRYHEPEEAESFFHRNNQPDQQWCDAHGQDYMPVIFPGFSSYNMFDATKPLNAYPRLQGRFFWRQMTLAKETGAKMLYVAMFDEIDEGTAIYKCENDPPVCPGTITKFLDYEGLPADHYLWLAGQAKRLLSGEIPATALPPARSEVTIP